MTTDPRPERASRVPGIALIVVGLAAVAVGLGADLVRGGGTAGLGWRQMVLAAIGAFLAGAGIVLLGPNDKGIHGWLHRRLGPLPSCSPLACVGLSAWFGLIIGIVEIIHAVLRKTWGGVILKQPYDLVWMAPVSYLVMFGTFGLGLALIARLLCPLRLPVVAFLLGSLATWSQLLMHRWLDSLAIAFLALAIGAQIARVAASRGPEFQRFARISAKWATGLVVVASVIVLGGRAWLEISTNDSLPETDRNAPNVLFVVLDTVRADRTSLHGHDRDTTPELERLAQHGVTFDMAISTAPWTLPSHASMFTGRYHCEMNADWTDPLDEEHPTLGEQLRDRGYATAGFVGNLMYCLAEHGLARGFTHYEDFQRNLGTLTLSTSLGRFLASQVLADEIRTLAENDAEVIADRFLRWLPNAGDRPWFAFLNFIDAHALYMPPPKYATMYGPESPMVPYWYDLTKWGPAAVPGFLDAYDGCIRYIDDQLARVFAHLEESGELENTVIVVTGDHGELFGENGLYDHGNSLYHPLLHSPLLIVYPSRTPGGTRIDTAVSLVDLAATVLDLADVAPSLGIPGHSLAAHWEGGEIAPAPLLSEVSKGINTPANEPRSKGDMQSIYLDGWHYIRNGDGSEALYEIADDPREEANLIESPRGQAMAPRCRTALEAATHGR